MALRPLRSCIVACGLVAGALSLGACGGSSSSSAACPPAADTRAAVNGKVTVCAFDVHYDVKEITAPAGPLEVTLLEKGSAPHTFTVKDLNFELKVGSSSQVSGTVQLQAGKTYEFHCSIPGHAATMHGTIVVK